jgi:hypothetical protein
MALLTQSSPHSSFVRTQGHEKRNQLAIYSSSTSKIIKFHDYWRHSFPALQEAEGQVNLGDPDEIDGSLA